MTTDDIDIAGMLDRIDTAWRDFHASYAGLSDDELLVPGVTEGWSVRDLLAHVAVWDAFALAALPGIVETGKHLDDGANGESTDDFNARTTEEHRGRSLAEIHEELAEGHARLLAYLRTLSDQAVAGNVPFRARLAADTWDHYPEHAAAIRAWREMHDDQRT